MNKDRVFELVDNFLIENHEVRFSKNQLMREAKSISILEDLSLEESILLYDELFKCIHDEHRVAKFNRVANFPVVALLPKRATVGSAGYDFFAPDDIHLFPGESTIVQTGMCCAIKKGWVLKIYPRSGLGFKYHAGLANTVGIIDSDYYYSDNGGQIIVKLVNNGSKEINIKQGEAFCQGIFSEYGLTIDDDVSLKRNGGFGSTTK